MSFRDTPWPEGTPCWVDMMADDVAEITRFYGDLLGWEFVDTGEDYGHYSIALVDGRATAAIGPKPPGVQAPSAWSTYLAADDADATVERITAAGGKLILPPGDVGEAARTAVAVDAAGAVFGIWQAGRTTGVQIANVPGALTWNECVTRDYPAAKRFYSDTFGHTFDEPSHGDFAYATIHVDAGDGAEAAEVGGIGALPDTVPAEISPHWTTYFAVTEVDAVVTRLVELGGTVHGGPVDSPRGRFAAVADPGGAHFRVIES
ncbi:VOC family protein [Prauserella halophila]|uniref:VOC family protein n=1 Tax=Prauserella halophila TaxID=185641 RepID=A0ABN1WDM0_9PSEU|nr:VOC family protein [Prauserella halophila]MCP2234201.1 hypothetical protein [Prauserella halophila]